MNFKKWNQGYTTRAWGRMVDGKFDYQTVLTHDIFQKVMLCMLGFYILIVSHLGGGRR